MRKSALRDRESDLEHSVPIAVVDPDPAFSDTVTKQLGDRLVGTFPGIEELSSNVAAGTPMVAVFGGEHSSGDGLKRLRAFVDRRPEVGVILIVPRLEAKLLQSALRMGVRDVLGSSFDEHELCAAVDRVAGSLRSIAALPHAEHRDEPGRLITIFSAKGGVGKSVTASNVAVALAQHVGASVVLVDLDLQFGDAAVMLDLAPKQTIVGAVGHSSDAEVLSSLLVKHEASGVSLLAAPLEPSLADEVSVTDVLAIIDVLRSMFEFVVLDTPAQLNDVVVSVLEESEQILMVTGLEVPSVKNAKLALQTLRLLNVAPERIKLVLNRTNPKNRFEVTEVERVLQTPADAVIPVDPAVPQAVNRGVPVVLDAPKSRAARSLEQLAADVAGAEPVTSNE